MLPTNTRSITLYIFEYLKTEWTRKRGKKRFCKGKDLMSPEF